MKQSDTVDTLAFQIGAVLKLEPKREYRWHPERKFRADLALVPQRIAVEVDGGGFVNGGHNRGAARRYDIEKDGEALKLGWLTIRVMPEHVESGQALSWVEALVRLRG